VTWTLLVVGVVVAIVVSSALWATRRGGRLRVFDIVLFLLLALAVCLALIVFEELTFTPKITAEEAETVVVTDINNLPIYASWVLGLVVVVGLLFSRAAGWWRRLYRFAELDVLLVMGTLVLPWLTAFILKATGADPTDYSPLGIQRTLAALIPFLAISIVTGLVWNWKRWLVCVLVFYVPFAFFFTTMFTNPQGLATGMIGSLGYWLNQQGVQRGSQPRYYYALVVMPVYEYLPLIGSFLAMLAGLATFWRVDDRKRKRLVLNEGESVEIIEEAGVAAEAAVEPEASRPNVPLMLQPGVLRRLSFPLFVSWWGIFNFIGYTLAGEKMPWLGTHLTLPLILLTAWYFGRVFENTDWAIFRRRGWLYLILLPLLGVALFQAASPFLLGASPFAGLQRQQLAEFYQWLAVVGVALLVIYLIVQVIIRTGMAHFRRMIGVAVFFALSLLTFRTALMASFINYDYANEYLVYAHGAPGIKRMMQEIEDVSLRTTDGMNVRFAWGGNAWPVTWYFRHLTNATFFAGNPTPQTLSDAVIVYASNDIKARVEPLLEDRYYKFEWIRMWWPDQDYFYLTGQRVLNALDFSPENTQAAQIRRGMFDIWWDRDYTTYGQAIGKDYSLENWPVSETFSLYVRKDVAAQVWSLGTGEGTVLNPLENQTVNVCTNNWQPKPAEVVFRLPDGTAMNHPLDIAVDDANDRVYVAEEFNNRVSVFDKAGNYLTSVQGGQGDFIETLTRPNGVAVAANGNLYIADTWNYLIREFTPNGSLVLSWGQAAQDGAAAQTNPVDGFWGPRDVALDADGNVYVADTGNKRVRVYDANGNFLRDIGSAGSGLGQLDEPSGLAIDTAARRLYVADTWNQRVSVFSLDGAPQFTFPVRGWYEDLGNRPYVALDTARNLVYVTDPDAGRVLVYDLLGNCVGSFGQPSDTPVDSTQFDTIGGIAVDADGYVYVADSAAGRLLKFAPFVDTVVTMPQNDQSNQSGGCGIPLLPEEATEEATSDAAAG
ncbi:MAG: 6-bladed beta-propeller, partial [Anaerolineae bacterium]|nr:6-bladed beta-propeller [Anaerolineae bacterium]